MWIAGNSPGLHDRRDGFRGFPAGETLSYRPRWASIVAAVEEIDRAIVAALTADGRLSYTDLAERVGLSVSAVHQRVRRLEQRGVIAGYTARVSYEALELPLTAFVAIRPFDPSQPDDAPVRLAHLSEIDSCYSVAGEDFYMLLVRVASPADLERLLQEIRTAANVTTRTTVVLSTPYENRPPRIGQVPSAEPATA
jgi:Lrp/AsnC family leucine-responsive transcriptional regulator